MSYARESKEVILPVLITANMATGDKFTWTVDKKMLIEDVKVILETAEAASPTTHPIFSLGAALSGVSGAEQGTGTTTDAQAIGSMVNISFTDFEVAVGDTLYFKVKTQGSSSAVTGYFMIRYKTIP